MKLYLFFILFIIAFNHTFSIEMNLKLERIDVDFNGIVNSEITTVCYGTGSIILCTTDNGNNWNQKCIHDDSLNISQMVFINNNFYALLTRDYYVLGDKEANNWKSIFTGITGQQSIEVFENFVFILGMQELFIFKDDKLQYKINLTDTHKFSELKIFKNKLIVSGEKGKLIAIDLNNYEQSLIDLESLGICQSCNSLRRIRIDNDRLYISHEADIIQTEDLINWSVVGRDFSLYDVRSGSLYDLKALNTTHLNTALLAFFKSEQGNNVRINHDWEQRNVDILAFTDYKFINDSVIVAVGRDKLIAVSHDYGINWALRSNFKSNRFDVVNDSCYYSVQTKGRIYRTLNSGITWLPPLLTDTLLTSFKLAVYTEFHNDGYGIIISDDADNRNNLLVTYDYGESYTLKIIKNLSGYMSAYNPSFIKTNEGYNVINPRGISKIPLTTLVKLDTGLNFVSFKDIYDSVEIRSVKRINDKEYLGLALDRHWPFYVDGKDIAYNYWFIKSTDDGESWEKLFELYMADTSLGPTVNKFENKLLMRGTYFYKEQRDTPNINQLFMIYMDTGKRIRIFNDVVSSYGPLTEFKNYLIFGGWECLFVNSNFNDNLLKWEKLPVHGLYVSSVDYKFDKLFFNTFDIFAFQTHLYHAILDFTAQVETQTEIKTYLYSYPPYPIPAKNRVMAEIFWDTRFDFDEADIAVFDYKGLKVADRKSVTLDRKNAYSGVLSWDCAGYEPGVYFVLLRHGGTTRTIPIVVGK